MTPVQKTVKCNIIAQFLFAAYLSFSCKVPGSGLELARALAPGLAARNEIEQFANDNPNTGSTPPLALFDPQNDIYQHIDVLKLLLFYNEDMGVVAGSGGHTRGRSVRNWMISPLV